MDFNLSKLMEVAMSEIQPHQYLLIEIQATKDRIILRPMKQSGERLGNDINFISPMRDGNYQIDKGVLKEFLNTHKVLREIHGVKDEKTNLYLERLISLFRKFESSHPDKSVKLQAPADIHIRYDTNIDDFVIKVHKPNEVES